jgi:D-lactate dehydrogenase
VIGARAARVAGANWEVVEWAARGALRAGHLLGDRATARISGGLRRVAGAERVPAWTAPMPRPGTRRMPPTGRDGAHAVYLPACVNRIFDPGGLPEALVAVSARAGRPVWIPPDAPGHCCATPFASKGYARAADAMAVRTLDALHRWSDGGMLPIVVDANSCALGLREHVARLAPDLRVLDGVQWCHDELLAALPAPRRIGRVALHPTCSLRLLGLEDALHELAQALADEVVTPSGASCCGMAGDRGLRHPTLAAAALADEAGDLGDDGPFDAHLCGNRTCEIALARETGADYVSPIVLLDELTR